MRKSNELTQTHRNSPKQINDEKRKNTDNRTKEKVKGNRSSMLKRRTNRKQTKKKSTNKIKRKHRKEQKEYRGNTITEEKKITRISQDPYQINKKVLKKTEAKANKIAKKYQIGGSKKMNNNRKRTE